MAGEEGVRLRRRVIEPRDLVKVTDALQRGFPLRPRAYWERGLDRMGERPTIAGCPRYGFLLEAGDRIVGVVLTLFSAVPQGRSAAIRCNLSSWYVEPDFRTHASLLIASLLRRTDVTLTNISPAPNTVATIETQGFKPYAEGQTFLIPKLARDPGPTYASVAPRDCPDMPEAALLGDHESFGCSCLVVETGSGPRPFIVARYRAKSGRLPLPFARLIYACDRDDLSTFSRPLGLWLLRSGYIGLVIGGQAPVPGWRTILRTKRGKKYYRGAAEPMGVDLSYSELVLFGA